jgi:hypothetical protein
VNPEDDLENLIDSDSGTAFKQDRKFIPLK